MNSRLVMLVALLLAISSLMNATLMIIDPETWYWMVPGVPDRGPFNQHFLRDIGFIYLLIGIAFLYGAFYPNNRFTIWLVPTIWLVTHATFHLWEIAVGICGPEFFLQDFPGVTLPAVLATWLVYVSKPGKINA
ncbi:hypothetical protein tinsulaeT_24280 [Thalassotalea insulae]|uniref:DUF4345 domain-containing protein n=1 Tax=Thalassotalea insulae TaxID=2056778 RepID=A0ABQ6GT12_9GAMM|nr:hypothetical protein [Thalassotalea insulae]GLX79088.1 hypothetical protein tinsulaeT_24280 [Thalassotalea insulae]